MIRNTLNVQLPILGCACDIHARYDASGVAYVGVYERLAARWFTTADGTLPVDVTAAALAALEGGRS